MKITLNWLKDFLETDASVEKIEETLIQLGHEIDGVEETIPTFNHVVVGRILTREQHPDADKLGVCTVEVAEGDVRQIVCGAPNARAGITVAVALEGAVLPGDFKIKKSKIRGVESNGMICSVRELTLGDEHDGIWELDTEAASGTPLNDVLEGADTIIEVDVTPNRGDALGVYGIARDLSAAGLGILKPLPEITGTLKGEGPEVMTETDGCLQFSGIKVSGLKNTQSPEWIKQRLIASGIQPKSALIDMTNYVMLTTGKPIHAYDADKVQGALRAQNAKGGEVFEGLGGVKVTLTAEDVVICDDSGDGQPRIVGLGGILGGVSTSVSDDTQNVIIESAVFDRARMALTGQRHGIQTDARYRMERGIDAEKSAYAGLYAAQLMQEICGGEISNQTVHGDLPEAKNIAFDPAFLSAFGGMDLPEERMKEILHSLGFVVDDSITPWQVTAPSFRTMMETPEDLVEEILRVEGYDKVPAKLLSTPTSSLRNIALQLTLDKMARRQLAAQGFMETITYSFIGGADAERFGEGAELLTLDNPLDEEAMTTMRPSLLAGLLKASVANKDRSTPMPRLAEVGKVFTAAYEEIMAAGVLLPDASRHWRGESAVPDAFSAKEEAQKLLATLGAPMAKLQVEAKAPGYFHPGRSGTLRLGKQAYAYFGELHPRILKAFGLKERVVAFEVFVEPLAKMGSKVKLFTTSSYQKTEKDLSFLFPEDTAADAILRTAQKAGGELCRGVTIFDVYQGENVPDGQKSMALGVTLQADDRTLNDQDIQTTVQAVADAITKQHGGQLRSKV